MFIEGFEKNAISMKTYLDAAKKADPKKALGKVQKSSMISGLKQFQGGKTNSQNAIINKHQMWRDATTWALK